VLQTYQASSWAGTVQRICDMVVIRANSNDGIAEHGKKRANVPVDQTGVFPGYRLEKRHLITV